MDPLLFWLVFVPLLVLLGVIYALFQRRRSSPVVKSSEKVSGSPECLWNFKFFYETNAFRLAGCPSNSETPSVISALNNLKIDLIYDAAAPNSIIHLDFNEDLLSNDVERAIHKISAGTLSRILEECQWFWTESPADVDALKVADRSALLADWKQRVSDPVPLHNLAVLSHIEAISLDQREIKDNGSKTISADAVRQHAEALRWWKSAHDSKACWKYVQRRAKDLGDPAVRRAEVRELRKSGLLLEAALGIHVAIAARAIDAKGYRQYAGQHLDLIIKKSGFPGDLVRKAVNKVIRGSSLEQELLGIGTPSQFQECAEAVSVMETVEQKAKAVHPELMDLYLIGRFDEPVMSILKSCDDWYQPLILEINDAQARLSAAVDVLSQINRQGNAAAFLLLRVDLRRLAGASQSKFREFLARVGQVLPLIARLGSLQSLGPEVRKALTERQKHAEESKMIASRELSNVEEMLRQLQ